MKPPLESLALSELGMHFRPSAGGVDRYFHDLLQGIEASGQSFTAAAFDGETRENAGVRRISLGSSETALWRRRAAIRAWGNGLGESPPPRVIATHFSLYAYFLLPYLRGSTHVIHFHGPWAEESAAAGAGKAGVWVRKAIERAVYARADHFITLSRAFRFVLMEQFGVRAEKISVVPGSVDLNKFHPPVHRESLRRGLGWPLNRRVVLCVRRLVPRMGIAELIDGFAGIAARFPDVDLRIGGTGESEEALRAQALRRGLEHRVIFCGFIPEEDLPDHYAAADLSILPSQKLEGFGLAALEALACGVPVLVTPVGGLPEAVSALSPRLVLPGMTSGSIASGLSSALEDPDFMPAARECRTFVESTYSTNDMARKVMEIYRQAAHQ